AFAFDGDFLLAEHIEFTHGVGLLINLAAFGGRSDGIKNAAFGDAGLDMLGDQLVAVASDTNAGIFGFRASGLGRQTIFNSFLCDSWDRTHSEKTVTATIEQH